VFYFSIYLAFRYIQKCISVSASHVMT